MPVDGTHAGKFQFRRTSDISWFITRSRRLALRPFNKSRLVIESMGAEIQNPLERIGDSIVLLFCEE